MLTKEILSTMSLKSLRLLDVASPEMEKLVQEAVSEKTAVLPTPHTFNRITVPDIKGPEQEAEWQAKIDAYEAENRPVEEQVVLAEKELESVKEELAIETPAMVEPAAEEVLPEVSPSETSETAPAPEESKTCETCAREFKTVTALKAHNTREHK